MEQSKSVDIVVYGASADEEAAIPVELDEMWSFYRSKSHQIWLWWAVEHETNTPLACVFGTREHKYLDELLTLRTRIKRLCRKTICFSKKLSIHKAVIGTFVNIHFFGRKFDVSTIL